MTRLVLHVGAEFADGGAVHRDLVAGRERLAEVGVVLPAGDTPAEWRDIGLSLVRGPLSGSARDLIRNATSAGVDMVLVSSDALSDVLTSPDETAGLAAMAAAQGVDVRIVVVVREQIGYITSLYCRRVLSLDTARGFAEFAADPVPAHRFDYVASFGAIADTAGLELVAIAYPDLRRRGAGPAVLGAAGLADDVLAQLPAGTPPTGELPGPVLVAATRLLHKRMRRHGLFTEFGKPRLRELVEELTDHARRSGWDSSPFWGWDTQLRRTAEEEYGASNDLFSQFVWGTVWPEPWSSGVPQRVDLAELEPGLLRDVLTTVEQLVRRLVKR